MGVDVVILPTYSIQQHKHTSKYSATIQYRLYNLDKERRSDGSTVAIF